jgi:hypothetical protein
MPSPFHVFVCARTGVDSDILKRDLLRSPAIAKNLVPLTVLWDQRSASIAFAKTLQSATAEHLIFTHCDVFFPTRWFERLEWEIGRLARLDDSWAVLGFSALTASQELVGRIWDASLEPLSRGVYGKALTEPVPIVSTDEMAFVVRRGSGVSFDPSLPNFHLYATDIVLTAEKEGKRCYGLDMPLIHNAKAQLHVGRDYATSYNYMVRKWKSRLPVLTLCGTITSNPFIPTFRRLRVRYKALCRPSTYSTQRVDDPRVKSIELGLDEMLAAPMEIFGFSGV